MSNKPAARGQRRHFPGALSFTLRFRIRLPEEKRADVLKAKMLPPDAGAAFGH